MSGETRQRMNRIYRRQRHIYDATRRYFLFGRAELIAGLRPPERGSVLEIGCGTAWNLRQAALRYPDVDLYGLDISSEMLASAQAAVASAGLRGRITLAEADASTLDGARTFGRQRFDRVFASYTLSMIPDWPAALARAIDHLAPAGSLHIVDFGQSEQLPAPVRRALFAWLARFDVVPRADLEATLRRLAVAHGLDLHFASLLRGYAVYAVLRRI